VALHATGDAGVRAALASFRAAGPEGFRDRVEHAFLVDPADIPQLVASGTVVSVQPGFLARDLDQGDLDQGDTDQGDTDQGGVYERRFGEERCANVLPLRTLMDAGVTLAFGTDFSLNSLDPRLGLRAAVTRRGHSGLPQQGWHAEQCLTLEEALRAYTLGSAIAEGAEAHKGTITVGKLADLVVFERDLFEVDPRELPSVAILATVVGGRVVHYQR
jgi:predicted amidohydrolase YtcJ